MRPQISWADLKGRRIGVWGLGVEGRASLRRLATLDTDVVLVDDTPSAQPVDGRPVLATDAEGVAALLGTEVVIKSPGISRYRPEVSRIEAAGVPVVGGLGLWLEGADCNRVVCITGTKGKSTTTAIAGHLLGRLGYQVLTGGNLGLPPYDPQVGDDFDFWIIETSSYQATDLASTPPVTAVTSLHPDHLNWHGGGTEAYFSDKLSMCHQPGAHVTVVNGDSDLLRVRRDRLGPRVRWVHAADATTAAWIDQLGLLGEHNRRNALIAQACLAELGVVAAADPDALAVAAAGFEPLECRLQPVGTVDGVLFVDDGLSTNVLPALAAVDAFAGRRLALLVGGADRAIDYTPLVEGLARRADPTLVIVIDSEAGKKMTAAFGAISAAPTVEIVAANDLAVATLMGHQWARPDGVVLLSPAAPSFDRYHDYRHRAAAFRAAIRNSLRERRP